MKRRRRLIGAGCILIISLSIMTACVKKLELEEVTKGSYEDTYVPSAKEISDLVDILNQEKTQNEVISGDVFEFYIDSDVNIVKLQMPADYVKEGAAQAGSSFETVFDLTGEDRGGYEMKVVVLSMEDPLVQGPLEYIERRYPNDIPGSTRIPLIAPHGQSGSYKAIYKESVSDGFKSPKVSLYGLKTIGFGDGSDETEAVLYIETKITNNTELSYDSIYKVLDSILLVNVDDDEVRSVIADLVDR